MSKEKSDSRVQQGEVFYQIHENYNDLNDMMIREIELASVHDGLTGSYREQMWMKFFRDMIPMKYAMAQGVIIIDSYGGVSKEVDIAVFDEQYTPYVFQYNTLKFIPIEAVVMVIECKSTDYDPEKLKKWYDQIDKLKTHPTGIARTLRELSSGLTIPSQTGTRPIRVLASMKPIVKTSTLDKTKADLGKWFDFIIVESSTASDSAHRQKSWKLDVLVAKEGNTLNWWLDELSKREVIQRKEGEEASHKDVQTMNEAARAESDSPIVHETTLTGDDWVDFCDENKNFGNLKLSDLKIPQNPLLTLKLQLNQLLMLINNPMLFPHFAYAKAFRDWIPKFEQRTADNRGEE